MSYNKYRYDDIKYQRSCTSFYLSMMLANLPQERNLAMNSWLALLPISMSNFKIKVEMVHSFAPEKKVKGKEGESTCKSASAPVTSLPRCKGLSHAPLQARRENR